MVDIKTRPEKTKCIVGYSYSISSFTLYSSTLAEWVWSEEANYHTGISLLKSISENRGINIISQIIYIIKTLVL